VVSVSVFPQVAANLIEHNDCPGQANQKENFFENDFHAISLTCFIARKPKQLEPACLIARDARNAKVSGKSADLN